MDDIDELGEQIQEVLDGTIIDMEHASLLEKLTDQMCEIENQADFFFTNDGVEFLNHKSADEIRAFMERVESLKKEIEDFTKHA